MNHTHLTDTLQSIEDETDGLICKPDSEDTNCYLLDEGGFIIAENIYEERVSHVSQ